MEMMAASDTVLDAPELCRFNAAELISLYGRLDVSPVEVAEATIERAAAINPKYNAFVLLDAEGALTSARSSEKRWRQRSPCGPLDGIPVTVKNLISVKGWPLRMGSLTTRADEAAEDAPTVQSMRDAGAILIGSTTTCEFGWKGVADSPLCGVTRNPWNPEMTSGGSSGGAAVAAATGCGVMHLGSDGGGSIRIPASFNGMVGHKPSFGRVPYFPPSAFGTVGHLGPIARTVDDAALMLEVISTRDIRDWHQNPLNFTSVRPPGDRPQLKGMRIGLWTEPPVGRTDPEILAATIAIARASERLGASVELIKLPGENLLATFNILWFAGAANRVRKIALDKRASVDPGLLEIAEIGASYSAVEYVEAAMQRADFGTKMDRLLERYDLIISPSTPVSAFRAGHDVPPDSGLRFWTEWASFNFPLNLSQQPACSIPVAATGTGLPIGLQLIGPKAADRYVLGAAAQFVDLAGGGATFFAGNTPRMVA